MNTPHSLLLILVMAAVTVLLRALPFLLFPSGSKWPRSVFYLSRVLPPAVIAMLVIYCLKDVSFGAAGAYLPELIAVAVVALLHIWKKQPLLSIGAGTVCYMLLIQHVF